MPEQYVPWLRRGSSEVENGPYMVAVTSEHPLSANVVEVIKKEMELSFRKAGAAVPPIVVLGDGLDVRVDGRGHEGFWHLEGKTIRVAAVTHIDWKPKIDAETTTRAMVWFTGGMPAYLDEQQAKQLKAIVGA